MEETKEVTLSNGKVLKLRGRTYWDLLDRKKDGTESEQQLEWFSTCIVEPKVTKDEIKDLISKVDDGITVAKAISSLETVDQDFQE